MTAIIRKPVIILGVSLLLACGILLSLLLLFREGRLAAMNPQDILSTDSLLLYAEERTSQADFLPNPPEVLEGHLLGGKTGAIYQGAQGIEVVTFRKIRSREDRRSLDALLASGQFPAHIIGSHIAYGESSALLRLREPGSERTLAEDPLFRTVFRALPGEAALRFLLRGQEGLQVISPILPPLLQKRIGGSMPAALALTARDGAFDAIVLRAGSGAITRTSVLPELSEDPTYSLLTAIGGTSLQRDLAYGIGSFAEGLPGRDLVLRGALEAAVHRALSPDANVASILTRLGELPYAFFLRSGSGGELSFALTLRDVTDTSEEIFLSLQKDFAERFPKATLRTRTFPPERVVRDIISDPSQIQESHWVEHGYSVRSVFSKATQEELLVARQRSGDEVILADDHNLLSALLAAPKEKRRVSREIWLSAEALSRTSPLLSDAPAFQVLRRMLGEKGILRLRESVEGALERFELSLEGVENGKHMP